MILVNDIFVMQERTMKKVYAILSAVSLSLLLTACNSLSVANYDKLKMGMSYEEVSGIIGKTEGCNEALGTRTCLWGDAEKQIKVVFVANRATFFSHKGLN
jgi:hypothetical protein